MKRNKKLLSIFLCLSMVLGVACATENKNENADGKLPSSESTTEVTETEAPTTTTTKETEETTPVITVSATPTNSPTPTPPEMDKDKSELSMEELFKFYPEDFPVIDSSTARKPITAGIYEYFMEGYDKEDKLPLCSKTHGAWINLADKVADLVFLVAPTEEEESHFREVKVNIEMKPYGYDGLGFIVSPDCPVRSLTQEQIRGIYECKITNWKEVGGPDAEIHPYFRDEQSGSQRLFEEFLWPDGDAPDFSSMMDHFYFEDDMESITDSVSADKYAIGYNIISYLDWAFENGYIDLVAIDSVVPKTETFKDNSYPYITPAYVAIRADEPKDSPARRLYDWIGSEKSVEIISGNSSLSVNVGESKILKYDS